MGVEPGLCKKFHRAVELIGRRWSGAIVSILVLRGSCRYNELLAAIPGISDRLLTERLRELERAGVVERTVEPGPPVRVSYTLTESGRALEPAIAAIGAWAERYVDALEPLGASA